jgi:hypothetical protein
MKNVINNNFPIDMSKRFSLKMIQTLIIFICNNYDEKPNLHLHRIRTYKIWLGYT